MKAIFIAKSGTLLSYANADAYRPIRLKSFMLKTDILETILIREVNVWGFNTDEFEETLCPLMNTAASVVVY